ncbi:MAG: ABC transporter permease [Clostridiales Family XIII bacterium]|jgi:ribose/xylose/arabinose/galactoside ABC-type transport system permease subunit|nr:ABC transporter permease [Clostridiales Family XIII bacterium]
MMTEKTTRKQRSEADLFFSKYAMLFVLLGIIVVSGFINPAFLTGQNLLNILKQVSATGILALGMTFVIISGGVDLSLGAIMSICGIIGVGLIPSVGIVPAIVCAIAAGFGFGALNGWFVSLTGGTMGSSFIVTFGMSTVIGSAALSITNGALVHAIDYPGYMVVGQGSWGIVPIAVVIFAAFVLLSWHLLNKTSFGRYTYCLGVNDEATRLSGVNVLKTRVMIYAVAGMMAAVGAILLTSRVRSASPVQGDGYELDAIAVVVLGGSRMGGGAGSAEKTLIGVIVFGVLTNALNVLGVSSFQQMIVKGVIILVAVLIALRTVKVENELLAKAT